ESCSYLAVIVARRLGNRLTSNRKRQVSDRVGLPAYKFTISGDGGLVGELDAFELPIQALPDLAHDALREGLDREGAAFARAAVDHRHNGRAQYKIAGHDRGAGGVFEFDGASAFELKLILRALRIAQSDTAQHRGRRGVNGLDCGGFV